MSEEKVSIGGIKFSEKLVHISSINSGTGDSSFGSLLHLLAENKINIGFLCYSSQKYFSKSSFCVSHADFISVEKLLKLPSFKNLNFEVIHSVGTITLFPHRNSLSLLGLLLTVIAKPGLPVYSLSTSISAIAVNTEYLSLGAIAVKLLDVVSLPENHAPFRKEFCLKQV